MFVDSSVLHLKLVRVSPELALWVEVVEHLPVHGHVSASLICSWKWAELDLKFNEFSEHSWREFDFDDSLLIVSQSSTLIVLNGVLLNLPTLLENNILVLNLSKVLRKHIVSLLFESENTLRGHYHPLNHRHFHNIL